MKSVNVLINSAISENKLLDSASTEHEHSV